MKKPQTGTKAKGVKDYGTIIPSSEQVKEQLCKRRKLDMEEARRTVDLLLADLSKAQQDINSAFLQTALGLFYNMSVLAGENCLNTAKFESPLELLAALQNESYISPDELFTEYIKALWARVKPLAKLCRPKKTSGNSTRHIEISTLVNNYGKKEDE